jgi:hypothetical protein
MMRTAAEAAKAANSNSVAIHAARPVHSNADEL